MSITTDQIRDAIVALPVGAPAIAEHLRSLSIKALCGNAEKCALAEYFLQTLPLPENWGVSVGLYAVSVGEYGPVCGCAEGCAYRDLDTLVTVSFLSAGRQDLSEFVGMFDDHVFPDLEAVEVNA